MAWVKRQPPAVPLDPDLLLRLLQHVRKDENGCWVWTGTLKTALGPHGTYGLTSYKGSMRLAHRVFFEIFVGELLPGFVVDHRCGNKLCVNPDHLEAVTFSENSKRGAVRGARHYLGGRTHCPHGHPFSGANLRLAVDKQGRAHRICRACCAAHTRKYRERLKQVPPIGFAPIGPISDYLNGEP